MDYFHIYSLPPHPPPFFRLKLFIIIIKNRPAPISKVLHPYIQTYKLDQFKMANTNNKERRVNQAPLATVDWQWHGIVRMIASTEKIQTQEYVQQCAQREANREAAIPPTEEQLKLMLVSLSGTNRERLLGSLDAFRSTTNFFEEVRPRPECLKKHNSQ